MINGITRKEIFVKFKIEMRNQNAPTCQDRPDRLEILVRLSGSGYLLDEANSSRREELLDFEAPRRGDSNSPLEEARSMVSRAESPREAPVLVPRSQRLKKRQLQTIPEFRVTKFEFRVLNQRG